MKRSRIRIHEDFWDKETIWEVKPKPKLIIPQKIQQPTYCIILDLEKLNQNQLFLIFSIHY
tara:strand:- start:1904 stop:2086 length:183 start_codon:yes stop_codon:yes gene_type:complete